MSNEEMNDIIKIDKPLEDAGLLIKSVSETIKHEAKEQDGRFLVGHKNIITNIYRIQTNDSIMCVYYFTVFIDFMLKGKSLLDNTILVSQKEYEKNDKIILKYFQ